MCLFQHLRIKRFFGTSENAVKTQVWIAVGMYVLVAIIRKRLNLSLSLHTMLQILSVTPFEKQSRLQLLKEAEAMESTEKNPRMKSAPAPHTRAPFPVRAARFDSTDYWRTPTKIAGVPPLVTLASTNALPSALIAPVLTLPPESVNVIVPSAATV